jgi:hypothetical protein
VACGAGMKLLGRIEVLRAGALRDRHSRQEPGNEGKGGMTPKIAVNDKQRTQLAILGYFLFTIGVFTEIFVDKFIGGELSIIGCMFGTLMSCKEDKIRRSIRLLAWAVMILVTIQLIMNVIFEIIMHIYR